MNKKTIFINSILTLIIITFVTTLILKDGNRNYDAKINASTKQLNTKILVDNIKMLPVAKEEKIDETTEKENIDVNTNENINNTKNNKKDNNNTETNKNVEQKNIVQENKQKEQPVISQVEPTIKPQEGVYKGLTLTGSMTAYGRDCCSSDPNLQGRTSSGYNTKKDGMIYHDSEYGNVRILATSTDFKLYSIIKINDPIDGVYNAIVLDRAGGNIGIGKKYLFDLVVESQEYARSNYGVHRNIKFEVLRVGR